MVVKKWLSTALALVIGASMFAGLAVTASADDVDVRAVGYRDNNKENTTAWTGEYEALPTEPTVTGDVITVTPANAQYTLDGAYGSLDGKTIKFSAGTYDTLVLARPTKYVGSNTTYRYGGADTQTLEYADYVAYKAQDHWTEYSYYTRTMENVTFTAGGNVTIHGIVTVGGAHVYGTENEPVYDYVRDCGKWCYDANDGYYTSAILRNITFKGISFDKTVSIDTSSADTVFDGVTFDNCSFTTGGTASTNGAAIHYYNEGNDENTALVKNLTVTNCSFTNVNQGVYVHNFDSVTVMNNTFDTTGHNAIALQSHGGRYSTGDVLIVGNTMTNIGDRAIRFGNMKDADIIITDNTAQLADGESEESMKAVSIAEDCTATIYDNTWNNYSAAANEKLKETDPTVAENENNKITLESITPDEQAALDTLLQNANVGNWKAYTTTTTMQGNNRMLLTSTMVRESDGLTKTWYKDLAASEVNNATLKLGVFFFNIPQGVTVNAPVVKVMQ